MKTDDKYGRLLFLPVIIIIASVLLLGYNLLAHSGFIKPFETMQSNTKAETKNNKSVMVETISLNQFSPEIVSETPVDINSATAAQLDALPQIGEKKAKAIIETRTKMGGFKTVRDLLCVEGIGVGVFKKIAGLVTVLEYDAATDAQN